MIRIVDLVKIYGKGEDALLALNHLSLTLPDTGLVFILGKSGCGKSTLLNMLGGLDDITSGDIYYDDVAISRMGEKELNNYRGNYVGIIYQNFNLFEKESVFDNVYIAGKALEKEALAAKIDKVLDDLMLSDKKHTLVKNLSGGQKQRVAIARALIKDSRVILADEPTGNLDSKNTEMIFDILRAAAKDRLVVVVSHDIKSAEAYADRIIYLSDGSVYDDQQRNTSFVETDNLVLEVPVDCGLSEEKIDKLNEELAENKLELRKNKQKFTPTVSPEPTPTRRADVQTRDKHVATPLGVSIKFLKSTWVSFVFSILLLSGIIALLAFSSTLIRFDASNAIRTVNEEYDAKAYVLQKAYSFYDDPYNISKANLYEIDAGDAQAFVDGGYTGNVYPIYNVSISNGHTDKYEHSDNDIYKNFYAKGGLGVVVTDVDYLRRTFGEMEVVAGSFYGLETDDKIVITDYLADSLLMTAKLSLSTDYISDDPNDPYQKLVNTVLKARFRVGAIIKTDYKERYADLLALYNQLIQEPQHEDEIRKAIKADPMLNYFLTEVNTKLNYGYSLNPRYQEAILDAPDDYYLTFAETYTINDMADEFFAPGTALKFYSKRDATDLAKGEMSMSLATYNTLFGKKIKADKVGFEEQEIIFKFHKYNEPLGADAFLSMPIKVVDVYDSSGDTGQVGRLNYEDYRILKDAYLFPYALLFDDPYQSFELNTQSVELLYYSDLSVYSPVVTVCQIIDVFSGIFKFIFIALIGIAAIILLMHNLRVIKRSRYLIGVYKSLGYPSGFFTGVSVLESLYLNVGVFSFSAVFAYLTTTFINKILTASFAKFFKEPLIAKMQLIGFSFPTVALYVAIIFGVSILTFAASIVSIRRLKPNNILHKAVE